MKPGDLVKTVGPRGLLAIGAYVAAAVLPLVVAASALSGLGDAYGAYGAARERLAALEARARPGAASGETPGSPFLDGPTITVAGAGLQRRVAAAAAEAGAVVLSSQVDLQDESQANDGFVRLSASLEAAQEAIQPLLHDLETGLPLLFVEQIVVQAPNGASQKMRVQLDVAGQWRDKH
ncbi:type II secretion system protein GspM [Methylocella sp.]|uniref:type II secretion system protein GspM n=1 Tax=Methylocella sp. TaxID=1978226 RepID=UPI0037845C40